MSQLQGLSGAMNTIGKELIKMTLVALRTPE
jgi:hypothetical protein